MKLLTFFLNAYLLVIVRGKHLTKNKKADTFVEK